MLEIFCGTEKWTYLRLKLCSVGAAPGRNPLDSYSGGSPRGPHTAGRTRPTWSSHQSLQHTVMGSKQKRKKSPNPYLFSERQRGRYIDV